MTNIDARGFTLIELMIVVAIIGILATITIPAYQNYTTQIQFSRALNMLNATKAEIMIYYGTTGICPTTTEEIGYDSAGTRSSKYVEKIIINTS